MSDDTYILSIFERIMKCHIMHHLELHNLIFKHEHGFRRNRSTESQLLERANWACSLFAQEAMDVFYLDISKAFDSVRHPKLLQKLLCYGIQGKPLAWVENFLYDRKQAVRVDGVLLDYYLYYP